MGEHSRLGPDPEGTVRGDAIHQSMEAVAEDSVGVATTVKERLDESAEDLVTIDYRWWQPAALRAVKAQQVRSVIKSRRLREDVFGENLFGEPAWDMLLDLFAAHLEQKRVSVSSLQIASAVPSTTALRWMARLEAKGLMMRHADPIDARRVFVALTDEGLDVMERYWVKLWALGAD